MHIYYLSEPEHNIRQAQDNCTGGSSRVHVQGGQWYKARERAVAHAIDHGIDRIMIVCGNTKTYQRDRQVGIQMRELTKPIAHGLQLYVNRLLLRHAHVYVPPMKWLRTLPLSGLLNTPTIPMVAAYRTSALMHVNTREPFGKILCGLGYDSFTVGDYVYDHLGPTHLDEPGSATTWNDAYERAIGDLLT